MTDYHAFLQRSRLYPVLVLEDWFSHRARRGLLRLNQSILLLTLFTLALFWWSGLIFNLNLILGLAALYLALVLMVLLLESYFQSFYFNSIINNDYSSGDVFTFTVGRFLYQATAAGRRSLWFGWERSEIGRQLLTRWGISHADWQAWLETKPSPPALLLAPVSGDVLRLRPLIDRLLAASPALSGFLFKRGLSVADALAATDWVVRQIETLATQERWWSRERLRQLPVLAGDWAYGGGFVLARFSRNLLTAPAALPSALQVDVYPAEVAKVETALQRSAESNVLLVGEAGQAKLEVLWQLARAINGQTTTPQLWAKKLILFNSSLFLATVTAAKSFEQTLLAVLTDASRAGNVILTIDNLANLVRAADQYAVNLTSLLDPYLSDLGLPVIALVDNDDYRQTIEPRPALTRRFELVRVAAPGPALLWQWLEDQALELERREGLSFTYLAIKAVAAGAEQYFQGETLSDQAVDVLVSVVALARSRGETIIQPELVWQQIKEQTGIPLGTLETDEREKLLQLETLLGRLVIGQREAIKLVSNAIRRNRAGVRNPKRPAGSFLFLGPTGVGKTETAKALATILFGQPESLQRLDMSEYQGPEALTRLLGSFEQGRPGTLANLLREHPYGVLLLDEFEKSHPDVRNLFLQILDEGFFSDMTGRRVNARNLIFIATSNAGAELIWQWFKTGATPTNPKSELINHLVTTGLFKPELLNRFDGLVLFTPLSPAELAEVAKLQLQALANRLRDRGLELIINDDLIQLVAREGANQQFGARPMNRYIQDQIEQTIANQLIAGEIPTGAQVVYRQGEWQINH